MHSAVSKHVFVRPVASSFRNALFRCLSRARRRSSRTPRRSSAIASARRNWQVALTQDGQGSSPRPNVAET